MSKLSREEVRAFLDENYYDKGAEWCANVLNIAVPTLYTKVSRLGISSRDKMAEKSCQWEDTFFDEWSHKMAYVLGFIFADGALVRNRNSYRISLYQNNREYLEGIADLMGLPRERVKTYGEESVIPLGSKHAGQRLYDLGVRPNKSHRDDPFPKVPEECLSSFVLGYFDGDGCVSVTKGAKNRTVTYFDMCGQKSFLSGMSKRIINSIGTFSHRIRQPSIDIQVWHFNLFRRAEQQRILTWMYSKTPYFLKRKKKTADELCYLSLRACLGVREDKINFIRSNYAKGVDWCADQLGLSPATIKQYMSETGLFKEKLGRIWRFRQRVLDIYYSKHGMAYCAKKMGLAPSSLRIYLKGRLHV
ncbi:hypothetical protein DRO66_02525 [Candidatus Bathyarchaeota archaeon]|nr:MAG: hypothetical protein DRO66_02525 [Candidatus Bathyarchaeota archaeon]